MPCSVNLKVNNATRTKRFNRVELQTLRMVSLSQVNLSNKRILQKGVQWNFIYIISKDVAIVSKPVNEMTYISSYLFTKTGSDIQRKVISTRIVSTYAFRSAHQVR